MLISDQMRDTIVDKRSKYLTLADALEILRAARYSKSDIALFGENAFNKAQLFNDKFVSRVDRLSLVA